MPKEEKMVDIDTSGEGAEIDLKEKEQHEKKRQKIFFGSSRETNQWSESQRVWAC